MGRVNVGHHVVGVVGLALLRTWQSDQVSAGEFLQEIAGIVTAPGQPPLSAELDVPVLDVESGYALWAGTYDDGGNPLIAIEEPVMRGLIDELPTGHVLDAACGTGRYARYLLDRGHTVVGVDTSNAMLAKARERAPEAAYRPGQLEALPVESASQDAVVCGLALTHCENLARPIAEFARVLRPGGRLLLSDFHPTMACLMGTALFIAEDGSAGSVRTFHHLHSTYLDAFAAAGLRVERTIEPFNDSDMLGADGTLFSLPRNAARAAFAGLPGALIWSLVKL